MKSKKLTPEKKSFVEFVKSVIGSQKNIYKIRDTLESNKFELVGCGEYKNVYKRKNDNFCVKVYHESCGWQEDSYRVPALLKKHFVYPIYKNRRYLIQPWIKGRYSPYGYKKNVKTLPHEVIDSIYDIRPENIRVHVDREVVIDFCHWFLVDKI